MIRWISLLFLSGNVLAAPVTLTWTNATLNTDGTPYDDPDITRIYYGECESGDIPASPLIQVAPATDETATLDLGVGNWCFRATHVNQAGEESAPSGLATYSLTQPNPPQDLTVSVDLTAFAISQSRDRLVLFPVGTVEPLTACDPDTTVNGKYRVPRDSITLAGTVDPPVVFAECVAP